MIWAALVFSVCNALVIICTLAVVKIWIARTRRQAEDIIRVALTAPDKDTPAPLAKLLDQCALLLAARFMQQIKAAAGGVEKEVQRAAGAEALGQAMEGSPLLALLAGIVPAKIRNKLLSNPQMVGALAKMSQGFAGGNHDSGSTPGPKQGSFSL